jgi:hypothetical protein
MDKIDVVTGELGKVFKQHTSYNIRFVLKFLIQFSLLFHVMACIWIIIGSRNIPGSLLYSEDAEPGWIEIDSQREDFGLANIPPDLNYYYIYVTSVYFITTSAATIGYGDYGAKSTIEMIYVIIVQFTGMSVFSIISGAYKEIIKMPSVNDVIDNKVQDITMYLQRIDKVKNDSLDDVIYDETVDYVKISYLYGVVQTLHGDHQFYNNLPPELKKKLVFTLLSNFYQKLFFFFNDNINHNYADLIFIRKILSRLDCVLYLNNSKIVASGKQFLSIYFIWKGSVTIVCPGFKF